MTVNTYSIIPVPQRPEAVISILKTLHLDIPEIKEISITKVPDYDIKEVTHDKTGKIYKDAFYQIPFEVSFNDGREKEHRLLSVLVYPEATTDKEWYGERGGDYGELTTSARTNLSLSDSGSSRDILHAYTKALGGWYIESDYRDEEPLEFPLTDVLTVEARTEFAVSEFQKDLLNLMGKHLVKIDQDDLDNDKGIARDLNLLIAQFEYDIYNKIEESSPKKEGKSIGKGPIITRQ